MYGYYTPTKCLRKMNNWALTFVSSVPHLPAPAHGDLERHHTSLCPMYQAQRREAALPVSVYGCPPASQSWGQARLLHASLGVQGIQGRDRHSLREVCGLQQDEQFIIYSPDGMCYTC